MKLKEVMVTLSKLDPERMIFSSAPMFYGPFRSVLLSQRGVAKSGKSCLWEQSGCALSQQKKKKNLTTERDSKKIS